METSAPNTSAAQITVQDAQVAAAWNISPEGWAAISNEQRTDFRNRVAYVTGK